MLSIVLIAAAENVTAENACCDGVACSAAATCTNQFDCNPAVTINSDVSKAIEGCASAHTHIDPPISLPWGGVGVL